jgi:hypothetical protein
VNEPFANRPPANGPVQHEARSGRRRHAAGARGACRAPVRAGHAEGAGRGSRDYRADSLTCQSSGVTWMRRAGEPFHS